MNHKGEDKSTPAKAERSVYGLIADEPKGSLSSITLIERENKGPVRATLACQSNTGA